MRILIVDDDAEVRQAVRQRLGEGDFEVGEAANGEEGLQAFRRSPADLVITDLLVPDAGGLEIIRALRREFPGFQVVAMSGGGFSAPPDMLPVAPSRGAPAGQLAEVERVLNALAGRGPAAMPPRSGS